MGLPFGNLNLRFCKKKEAVLVFQKPSDFLKVSVGKCLYAFLKQNGSLFDWVFLFSNTVTI